MKKLICITAVVFTLMFSSCQATTKSLGGSMTLELEPNQKLEIITWKNSDLWYLTKPMTEEDEAVTHTFQQSSQWGVLEGTVTIIETKE